MQDALEQHREFRSGLVAIALGELDHGILHDIQRRMIVAHGICGLLEGATFDAGKEIGKLFSAGHGSGGKFVVCRMIANSCCSKGFRAARA
ncbi:hypothetical protein TK5_23810 [Sideroxyarcus sp. TK5]